MHTARRPRLLRPLVVAALALPLLAPTGASAEDAPAAGDVIVGRLTQAWPEYADPDQASARGQEGPLTWVRPVSGEPVRIVTDDLPDLPALEVGARVRVTVGGAVPDEAATQDGLEPAREVLRASVVTPAAEAPVAPAAPAGTTNAVTVALVRPGGAAADTTTLAAVADAVNGPVRTFWSEQTRGAVKVGVAAQHDWLTTTADCSDPQALWDEAASAVGWTAGPGKHLLLYLPAGATDCAYGLAEVGTAPASGGRLYVQDTLTSVLAHELGHNFGLGHSSALQCDRTVDAGSCLLTPYFDWYDVMGVSWEQLGTLALPQADLLGVLPADQVQRISTADPGGTFTLARVSATWGTRALRFTASDGSVYWLEYRYPAGRDIWLTDPAKNWPDVQAGPLLRLAAEGDDTSLLLDGTPSAAAGFDDDWDQALPWDRGAVVFAGGEFAVVGQSFDDEVWIVRVLMPARAVDAAAAAAGLGTRTGGLDCRLRGSGCVAVYQSGSVYWSAATGARVVRGAIGTRWVQLGRENGALGYPAGNQNCSLRGGGCFQLFQGGSLYWSPSTGARLVRGAIRDRWGSWGWEAGPLGYPVSDERCGLSGGGCYQLFQAGSIYWSAGTGAQVVRGAIRDRWASVGWEAGALGYPTTSEDCRLPRGGCFQQFQRGSVYWSPTSGAHPVGGAIRSTWAAFGWESGFLGYPTSGERCGLVRGGCFQTFQGGAVYWSPASGAQPVIPGGIFNAWAAQGFERGSLGYPIGPPGGINGDGGQTFQGGHLYWDPRTGRTTRF